MEPREIFQLILRADDALKYATQEKAAARAQQARSLLLRAKEEAQAIGNEALAAQVDRRLDDLDSVFGGAQAPTEATEPDAGG